MKQSLPQPPLPKAIFSIIVHTHVVLGFLQGRGQKPLQTFEVDVYNNSVKGLSPEQFSSTEYSTKG